MERLEIAGKAIVIGARRIGWLLAIWLASVLALGGVALLFRWVMGAVGLTA